MLDWSGTLVDDLPAVWRTTNHVLRQAGVAALSLDEFRSEFSLPFRDFYARYTPHIKPGDLETWFHDEFKKWEHLIQAQPFAIEFLQFCRCHGMRLLVFSTIQDRHYQAQAERFGLKDYYDHCYLSVHDKRQKVGAIIQELGLERRETLFVGDMQHDIETAKYGGIFSCAVLTGYNFLNQLRQAQPDIIVAHLGELKDILLKNGYESPRTGGLERTGLRRPVVTVGALIFNAQGQVLLVRTAKWSSLWGIPGGKIECGETAIEALRREIREETGLELRDIEFVFVQDCINNREFYREDHFVLLNYSAKCEDDSRVVLNHEAQSFVWLDPDRARSLPLNQPTINLLDVVCNPRR